MPIHKILCVAEEHSLVFVRRDKHRALFRVLFDVNLSLFLKGLDFLGRLFHVGLLPVMHALEVAPQVMRTTEGLAAML